MSSLAVPDPLPFLGVAKGSEETSEHPRRGKSEWRPSTHMQLSPVHPGK